MPARSSRATTDASDGPVTSDNGGASSSGRPSGRTARTSPVAPSATRNPLNGLYGSRWAIGQRWGVVSLARRLCACSGEAGCRRGRIWRGSDCEPFVLEKGRQAKNACRAKNTAVYRFASARLHPDSFAMDFAFELRDQYG